MDQLIPIASKLQDVLGALGQTTTLDLPQIVVVGGQSSGKSSVLEGIVGRSFLPRGHGIVTRRPLVLQLYNTSSSSSEDDDDDDENVNPQANEPNEWGEFLHLPNRVFYNFSEICHEIQRETDRLTGSNKGIHATPIHLKIYSPHVLSLTLVDLPGMAKVAVGDQPNDIEDLIREMCLSYISNPNAIILAVTAANTDLANSDALKLAQAVDPHGHRTVGVLTKVDLMDPGTDCVDVLQNKVVPLVRGYVAVVNRGQQDINDNVSIRDGLKKEALFFQNHPVYGRADASSSVLQKCGTRHLSKSLNNMLMHHIRNVLPELKTKICNMMADVQADLEALGSPMTLHSSKSSQGGALLSMLSKFASNFASIIEGRGGVGGSQQQQYYHYYHQNSPSSPHINATATTTHAAVNELFGGARISYIFTEIFSSSLMTVGPFDGLTDNEIRTTICNANGTRPALFVPEISFDILVKRQMARLEQPGIQCVDLVYEELQRIASQSEPSELTRFPNLRERMVEVVSSLLKRCVGPTQMMVANLVKIELAYINTSHPDFIGGSRAVAKLMEKIGNDNEARKLQRESSETNTDTTTTTTATPGTIHAHTSRTAAVGATPLSSSSLSNYYNPHVHDNDDNDSVETGALPPNSYHDLSGGGIMNFIFRGGKHPKANTTTNMSEYHHNHNRHYTNGRGGGGPPSIVHLPQVPDSMRQTDVPPTERERVEMEIIKSLIESYFAIVRKNFIDMVPKTIMYFLVNHVRDAIQNELVSELYRDAEIATLMQEAEDIAQRRQTCVEMRDLLSKALEIVNEVRDFNTFK